MIKTLYCPLCRHQMVVSDSDAALPGDSGKCANCGARFFYVHGICRETGDRVLQLEVTITVTNKE